MSEAHSRAMAGGEGQVPSSPRSARLQFQELMALLHAALTSCPLWPAVRASSGPSVSAKHARVGQGRPEGHHAHPIAEGLQRDLPSFLIFRRSMKIMFYEK